MLLQGVVGRFFKKDFLFFKDWRFLSRFCKLQVVRHKIEKIYLLRDCEKLNLIMKNLLFTDDIKIVVESCPISREVA